MYTVAVFIDLKKAFDTVNNKILLSKLKRHGVDGNYLKLFKSYLSKENNTCQIEILKRYINMWNAEFHKDQS